MGWQPTVAPRARLWPVPSAPTVVRATTVLLVCAGGLAACTVASTPKAAASPEAPSITAVMNARFATAVDLDHGGLLVTPPSVRAAKTATVTESQADAMFEATDAVAGPHAFAILGLGLVTVATRVEEPATTTTAASTDARRYPRRAAAPASTTSGATTAATHHHGTAPPRHRRPRRTPPTTAVGARTTPAPARSADVSRPPGLGGDRLGPAGGLHGIDHDHGRLGRRHHLHRRGHRCPYRSPGPGLPKRRRRRRARAPPRRRR